MPLLYFVRYIYPRYSNAQLVPRSRGLTKLDLNEVDTMLKHAEIEKNTQAVKNTPHII